VHSLGRDSIAERESERNLRRVLKGDWQQ